MGSEYIVFINNASSTFAFGVVAQARFRFLNLLSELDFPGEYFVDKAAAMLYFYPPATLSPQSDVRIVVSTVENWSFVFSSQSDSQTSLIRANNNNLLRYVAFQNMQVLNSYQGIAFANAADVFLQNLLISGQLTRWGVAVCFVGLFCVNHDAAAFLWRARA